MHLQARRLGPIALRTLFDRVATDDDAAPAAARCIASFERSAYVATEHGVVWLIGRGLPMGPIGIEVDTLPERGETVSIDARVASIWSPPPIVERPRWRMTAGRAASLPLDELVGRLGAGEGLTPEGDDFVIGYLIAANTIGLSVPGQRLLDEAKRLTHAISLAHLHAAAAGLGLEPFHHALNDLLVNEPDARTAAIERAECIGGSSGKATIDGMRACLGVISRPASAASNRQNG